MPRKIKNLFRLIQLNLGTFIVLQLLIVYSFMLLGLFRYFFIALVKDQLGVNLLVQDNFSQIIKQPLALVFFCVLLLIELFFLLVGMIGNYRIYAASVHGEKIKARKLVKEIFTTYLSLFLPRRILLLPILILTMLFSLSTFYTSTAESFQIPEFILEWFYEKPLYTVMYYVLRGLMTLLWIWMLFVITGVFMDRKSFRQGVKDTFQLIRSKKKSYGLFILFLLLGFPLLKSLLYFVVMGTTYLLTSGSKELLVEYLYAANWRASIYIPMISDVLQIGILVVFYLSYFSIPIEEPKLLDVPKSLPWRKRIFKRVAFALLFIILIEMYHSYTNPNQLYTDHLLRPKIIAHRAGGTLGPENSLEALKTTKESKLAAGVEIDVQLTKDHHVVLNHDPSLKRITGQDLKVGDLTLEEIKKLRNRDPKGRFDPVSIPTLEDFIHASGDLELMIELKESKERSEVLLDKVLEIIKEKKIEKRATIASMDREILKRSKEKEPKISTVLITAILWGSNYSEEYLDAYSIESGGGSKALVEDIHEKNKKIYVWTVNTTKGVKKALRARPDGIVTDNVFYTDYSIDAIEDSIPFQEDMMLYFLDKGADEREELWMNTMSEDE